MAINKVVYGNNTLLDLTEDTVTEDKVLKDETFHDASGQKRIGSLVIPVQDVEVNGESVVNSEKVAEIDIPTTDIQTAVDEFETYNGGLLSSLKVSLTPNQDLHGYDSPWVGGAGKNKCPLTVDGIKSANTTVTWNGNSCVFNGVTITILTDTNNNVIGLKFLGTASSYFYFNVNSNFTIDGTYIISPLPQGAAYSSAFYGRLYYTDGTDIGFLSSEATVTKQNAVGRMQIVVSTNATVDFTYQPMLRLATETDPTFEPYENICPISGHTEVDIDVSDGVNKINPDNMGHYGRNNATGQIDRTEANMSSTTNLVKVDPSTTYTIARNGTKYVLRVYYYGVDKSYIGNEVCDGTFTTPNDAYYIAWQSGNASGALDLWCMVEGSSSAYVPYNGYQVTVNLGGTYYSGTLDVVSGVFTPDTAFDTLSADNFNGETGTSGGGLHYYDWNNGLSKKSGICLCNMIPQNNTLAWQSTTPCIQMSSGGGVIRCYVEEATKEAFKTAYSGMQICYELATPTPIQLSPTMVKALVGENHLSAPLDGQEIVESKYKEAFDFNDVMKVANYFTLPLQTFTFTNKICNVNDSRVTSDSLVDVYFTSASMSSVEDAGITVESQSGKIVMTAEEQPVGTIQGRIKVVN